MFIPESKVNNEEVYKAWNLAVREEHFDKIKPM